jgi:hypothetical protein
MTLNELIDLATNTDNSIYDVFVKAKVFASRLGNIELLDWIEKETSGYGAKDSDLVPEYRVLNPIYRCSLISKDGILSKDCPLPVSWFNDEIGEQYLNGKARMLRGIVALQHSVASGNKDDFLTQLPADLDKKIDREISKYSEGVYVRYITVSISESSVIQLLAVIRNRLLDLLLAVGREFPDLQEIESAPRDEKELINQTIHIIMAKDSKTSISGTNITTSGSGNNVNANVGSKNTIDTKTEGITSKAITDFALLVRSEIAKQDFPAHAKEAVETQLETLTEEASKPEPKAGIINTALSTIHGVMLGVAGNLYTEPIKAGLKYIQGLIVG